MIEQITSDDVQELLEIGYLAVDEGWHEHAEAIFSTLVLCRPDNPHPRIGLALVAHGQRRVDDAIRYLEAVIADFPQAVFARSLLAHFMKLARRPGWAMPAYESLGLNATGVAADLARTVLELQAQPDPDAVMHGRLPPHARHV